MHRSLRQCVDLSKQGVIQDFFCQGGNWIGGDSSKRGTVFIYILMFSVHVVIKFQGGEIYQGRISRVPPSV